MAVVGDDEGCFAFGQRAVEVDAGHFALAVLADPALQGIVADAETGLVQGEKVVGMKLDTALALLYTDLYGHFTRERGPAHASVKLDVVAPGQHVVGKSVCLWVFDCGSHECLLFLSVIKLPEGYVHKCQNSRTGFIITFVT